MVSNVMIKSAKQRVRDANDGHLVTPVYIQTKKERLRHLRTMMLVHSCIYYRLHTTVISDDMWQKLANELVNLQKEYTDDIGWYDKEFKGWSGDTGMHLPFDSWVINKSMYAIKLHANPPKVEKEKDDGYFYY